MVAPSDLEPLDQRLTPGRPFTVLGGRGRGFPAAVNDPGLADLLEGSDPPALRAARFLGELTLVALEAPRDRRGVVVVRCTVLVWGRVRRRHVRHRARR